MIKSVILFLMRCNAGVNPIFLADQHLCELSELKMVPGTLVRINFKPKSIPPKTFKLNDGHISFFYDKIQYLARRHGSVYQECIRRGRKGSPFFYNTSSFNSSFNGDWSPTMSDSMIVRERIAAKLAAKNNYWRYQGEIIKDMNKFIKAMMESDLYHV